MFNQNQTYFINQYPAVKEYIFLRDGDTPHFFKLMTIIMYLRQTIGFPVSETESFYNSIQNVDAAIFEQFDQDILLKMLKYVITVACVRVDSEETFEDDHKQKIITRLIDYARNNNESNMERNSAAV
jgi:hypothetical protein